MRHIHLEQCDSTQDALKEQLRLYPSEEILVSTDHQLHGKGRQDRDWECFAGTLCFSFNVTPHKIISLTTLELSLLVCAYFREKNKKIGLKWPNDLIDELGFKCGGILIQTYQGQYIAGVGLNLWPEGDYGGVYHQSFPLWKKDFCHELTDYIEENRIHDSELLRKDWEQYCVHLNKKVTITENGDANSGTFLGIGEYGEALLSTESQQIKKIFNGTLRVI